MRERAETNLAPHPHVEANATDALHDAQRQEQRSSAPNKQQTNNAAMLISQQEALARQADTRSQVS
jgi:hypothetical protein